MKFSPYHRKAFPCPPLEGVGGGKKKLKQINYFGIQGDGITVNNPDNKNNQYHPLHPRPPAKVVRRTGQRGAIGIFQSSSFGEPQFFILQTLNDVVKISRLLPIAIGIGLLY